MSANKGAVLANATIAIADNYSEEDLIARNEKEIAENPDDTDKNAQLGVRKAEAAALVWSKPALYGIYAWIWICFLIYYFMGALDFQLRFYLYSTFYAAPQITQANLVAGIIGGIIGVPISKLLNTWGRAEAFVLLITIYTIGLAALAGCTGPASYAAGNVFFSLGGGSIFFILNIFVADTSGLYNRAILIGITNLTTYITSLAGPPIVQMFLDNQTWRWAYGSFAIIVPVTMLPLAGVLKMYQKKAEAKGIYVHAPKVERTFMQTIWHYIVEFDFIGAFLLGASFLAMLLPFTLHGYVNASYGSAKFIVPLVIGVLLFPVFVLWECYGLPSKTGKYYIRWELLKNRTIFGACMLGGITFFNSYAWDSYFYFYIMVVYNYSATRTAYACLANGFVATAVQIVLGLWIRRSKHFKAVCLWFGVPISIIGAGLLIKFRSSDYSIGLNILAQIFIGLGWGTLLLGYELAAYAASDRDGIPMVYALIGLSCTVFSSVASAVVTAIYNSTFPAALLRALPPDTVGDYMTITQGGSYTQMMYPVGSDTRNAINYAWGESQKYLCILAAAIMIPAFPAIWIWKDYRVDRQQVKGNVL
ncbi:hypothetical protein SEPCBS119000_006745 [Sporothrix epigloea]|uniref:Major facilitator superfamily (MFS) profile domain-containing protein n=1 Tax=Sporothrix epigloea TaxID=1892477 RepID=A0ABP0E7Z0_9PEZI